ncbi:MAG: inner membrane-spanning protein YciB [Alphaproteobacteria bacterium]|nr:inner membrane-spanning protein YciB [Alphaproteobacteria bacterium]
MTESSAQPVSASTAAAVKGAGNLWTDLGPVLAFVIVYNVVRRFPEGQGALSKENAIYWATGVFMAAILAVIGYTLAKGRRLPPMLMITGAVVLVFGALTLYLQDPRFAYYKPTIINLLFAGGILGSLAIGRNIWKTAFEHAFALPDHAWKVFALRWAAFYVVLAVLNEIIWRNFTEDVWSNSKIFLTIPLFIVFMMINLPFLMKHQIEPSPEDGADAGKA